MGRAVAGRLLCVTVGEGVETGRRECRDRVRGPVSDSTGTVGVADGRGLGGGIALGESLAIGRAVGFGLDVAPGVTSTMGVAVVPLPKTLTGPPRNMPNTSTEVQTRASASRREAGKGSSRVSRRSYLKRANAGLYLLDH
jgi:hypothetical protein